MKVYHENNIIYIASLNIFHVIENSTFQITIVFNSFFKNAANEYIYVLKLLYDTYYCTFLQDAESILENIVKNMKFSLSDFKDNYRFKDYKVEYFPNISLSNEEKKLLSGSSVIKNGELYVI